MKHMVVMRFINIPLRDVEFVEQSSHACVSAICMFAICYLLVCLLQIEHSLDGFNRVYKPLHF